MIITKIKINIHKNVVNKKNKGKISYQLGKWGWEVQRFTLVRAVDHSTKLRLGTWERAEVNLEGVDKNLCIITLSRCGSCLNQSIYKGDCEEPCWVSLILWRPVVTISKKGTWSYLWLGCQPVFGFHLIFSHSQTPESKMELLRDLSRFSLCNV